MYIGLHHCGSEHTVYTRLVHVVYTTSGYNHGEASLFNLSLSLPPAQEHFAKKDSMNSSQLWYSTVSHDVKHEASVINTDNQTEYAVVNVPKRKENAVRTEEHSEYDYVLIT